MSKKIKNKNLQVKLSLLHPCLKLIIAQTLIVKQVCIIVHTHPTKATNSMLSLAYLDVAPYT